MSEGPLLSGLENLPDDALLEILKYVPNSDLAVHVSEVSRRMRHVASHRTLWKRVRFTGLDDAQLDRAVAFLHSGTESVIVQDSASLYPRHLAAIPVQCPNLREFTVSRCNYRDEFVPRSSGAIFRTYVPHYWPTQSSAAMESLTTLTINDDPALSYARHLDIAADLPRLAPNLRVFHWHYGKQYDQDINYRLDFAELFPKLTHLCAAGSQFGRLDFFDAIKSLAELLWVNLWGTLVAETHIRREEDTLVSKLESTFGDIHLASRIQVVFEPCRRQ